MATIAQPVIPDKSPVPTPSSPTPLRPEAAVPGEIVDMAGRVAHGAHRGAPPAGRAGRQPGGARLQPPVADGPGALSARCPAWEDIRMTTLPFPDPLVRQAAAAVAAQSETPFDPVRYGKALDLVLAGAVTLLAEGTAQVCAGDITYRVTEACTCGCPTAQARGTSCTHLRTARGKHSPHWADSLAPGEHGRDVDEPARAGDLSRRVSGRAPAVQLHVPGHDGCGGARPPAPSAPPAPGAAGHRRGLRPRTGQ